MRQPKSFGAMALGANSFWPINLRYIALNSVVLQCATAKNVYLWTDPERANYFILESGTSISLDLEGGGLDISLGSELLSNGDSMGMQRGGP
jgi:hypothetical protein